MSYIDDLDQKMNIRTWPHQFTKKGKEVQVGEVDNDPIFAVPMVCVHCNVEYLNGKETRPPDPCPARNKNREMKRILS